MVFNFAQADIERFSFAHFVFCKLFCVLFGSFAHYGFERSNNAAFIYFAFANYNLTVFYAAGSFNNGKITFLLTPPKSPVFVVA